MNNIDQDNLLPKKVFNICVVTQQLKNILSGIGSHASNLVNQLIADGHQVTVIAPKGQCPDGDLNFKFIDVPSPKLFKNQARWLPLSIYFSNALKIIQKKQNFDIVHFTDARESVFCHSTAPMVGNVNDTYAADIKSIDYYKKYYIDWLPRYYYYKFVHQVEKIAFPRLDAVIAISKFTSDAISTAYSIKSDKLHVINFTIDINSFPSNRISQKLDYFNNPKILFIGGNMQRKGVPTIIQASQKIIQSFPSIEFWIVGQDKHEQRMKDLAKKLGVNKYFRFLGWQDRKGILSCLDQSSIFVLPSLTEAFGVVILEAMISGLPIVATEVGGIPEIITSGKDGLLIPPDSPNDFAEAIIKLLMDRNFYERIQQAAHDTVQNYDVKTMMDANYKLYNNVITDFTN